MGLIGDIYYAFRGDGARLQKDAQVEGAKAGTGLGKSMAANLKKSWSGKEIGRGLVQGLGLAGGLGAAALFSTAIAKVTDILGDATQAALEEEVSIQKLGTALRANVPNWDGQTAAIEKVLKARMALGFSDDEQRDSLARIVVATKDVNKALEVQRTAMDLSRLKGISLADAGDALIKVEGGQFRALKALGIQLPKNATATQALAAVQKAAAGQAEDYADTNAGKLLVSQVKVGEALEELGAVTMPMVVEVMTTGADIASDLADAFTGVGDAVKDNEDPLHNFANLFHDIFKSPEEDSRTFFGALGDGLNDFQRHLADGAADINDWWTFWDSHSTLADRRAARFAANTGDHVEALEKRALHALPTVGDALDSVGDAAGAMATDVDREAGKAATSVDEMKDDIVDDAQVLINQAFDPIIAHDRLIATNAEVAAQKRIIASSKSSKAEIANAKAALHSAQKDQAELLLTLARAGDTSSKAYKTGIADLKKNIKNATGPTKAYLQGVLTKLQQIDGTDPNVLITIKTALKGGYLGGARAEGGPVRAGQSYVVGEKRAELFIPDENGRIVPRVPSSTQVASTGGAGGDTNITVALPTTARPDPFEVADRLRWLNDFGVLRRVG